jgi:hypothetical protein
MDNHSFGNYSTYLPIAGMAAGGALIGLLAIWDLAWKGYGMWKAARNNEPIWFVAILLLNTLGILPILYIYIFAKDVKKKK